MDAGARSTRTLAAWILVVFAAGLGATWALSEAATERFRREGQYRFMRANDRLIADAQRRLTLPIFGLSGARAAFAANPAMGREGFARYVNGRDLAREFPGGRGIGFVERFARKDLPTLLSQPRADGLPWEVHTTPTADELFIITVIEPLDANRASLGFDLGSEPTRRAALERAIDTGEATLSAPLVLLQDEAKRRAMLLVLPVFRPGLPTRSAVERRAALRGLVFAPIIVQELFQGTLQAADGQLDLDIYDGDQPSESTALYDPDFHFQTGTHPALFEADTTLTLGGRTLLFHTRSTPQFEATLSHGEVRTVRLAGAALTLLLVTVVFLLGHGRLAALQLARDMTATCVKRSCAPSSCCANTKRSRAPSGTSSSSARPTRRAASPTSTTSWSRSAATRGKSCWGRTTGCSTPGCTRASSGPRCGAPSARGRPGAARCATAARTAPITGSTRW